MAAYWKGQRIMKKIKEWIIIILVSSFAPIVIAYFDYINNKQAVKNSEQAVKHGIETRKMVESFFKDYAESKQGVLDVEEVWMEPVFNSNNNSPLLPQRVYFSFKNWGERPVENIEIQGILVMINRTDCIVFACKKYSTFQKNVESNTKTIYPGTFITVDLLLLNPKDFSSPEVMPLIDSYMVIKLKYTDTISGDNYHRRLDLKVHLPDKHSLLKLPGKIQFGGLSKSELAELNKIIDIKDIKFDF
jgi:hypothetical protein